MPDLTTRSFLPLARTLARLTLLFGILSGFRSDAGPTAAQEPLQERSTPSAAPKPATSQRLKKIALPKRDVPDQLFRLAPMAEASRSIAIPLATNLHIAFDTQLLRTHMAWSGPSLSLFGPPYNGLKSPFLCAAEGTILWTMPPICPWNGGRSPTRRAETAPPGTRFRGLSTKAGVVTLFYDWGLGDGKIVRIYEQARTFRSGQRFGCVRRFEIGPSTEDLWFVAHAEMDASARHEREGAAIVIQRAHDALLAFARSSSPTSWVLVQGPESFEESLNAEEKGESVVRKKSISGREARAVLKIDAHAQEIAVEILSAAFQDSIEAETFGADFMEKLPAPANLAFVTAGERDPSAPKPKIFAGDKSAAIRESGDEHYRIEHFPLPKEIGLQATGMDWWSEDALAVCTWSGEIYIVEHARGSVGAATYRRFARGLNEPLGLKCFQGHIYVVQKPELTRITDTDGDGEADLYETVNADWGYTGNYHAFAFGPLMDKQNNFYAFLCGQHGRWDVPYVGWCVKISADGSKLDGFCSGLRAPNGFGFYGPDDDLFIADNQGNWVGACKLSHLRRGQFYGFPSGIPAVESEYKNPKAFAPPAVWFPRRLSPSTSGFITIEDDRFGPFQGQMLIGDFQKAVVLRVFLEKVNGQWQGAVWPFARGFLSGVNRLSMGPDGRLYVGGLKNAAWSASAPKDYSLERVTFTGKTPFEIKEVHATRDGFELAFTQRVDPASAGDPDQYDVRQFTYLYHETYGSPEIDHEGTKDSSTPISVKKAEVSVDRLKVRLILEGRKTGYVTWVRCQDIQNTEGVPLWHDSFYYTLNQIPAD